MGKCQKDPLCRIFLKRGLFKDIKNYIPPCLTHKVKNTNSQIHKYTNTAYDEVLEGPNMWYIFEKRIVQGYQKLYSHVPNAQIQKYKYTNTQIQHITKYQKDPTCGIFLKRGLFRGIKNDIHMCQTRKYKNTNTQIHKYTNTQIQHMTKCQIDPRCGIFLKIGLFKGIKNDTPMCQIRKYINTNTQIHKYSI